MKFTSVTKLSLFPFDFPSTGPGEPPLFEIPRCGCLLTAVCLRRIPGPLIPIKDLSTCWAESSPFLPPKIE